MDMTEAQRKDLAGRVTGKRLSDYGGNRRRAYNDVGVNSATWTKAEEGVPIAERSYVAIIAGLWPETHGDWRQLDPPLDGDDASDYAAEVRASNLSAAAKERIIRILADEQPPPEPDTERGSA